MWPTRPAQGAGFGTCCGKRCVRKKKYGLFARLSSAGAHTARRRLAARVFFFFQFALHCPNSSAHSTAQGLRLDGVVLPGSFGIGPGVCMGQVGLWSRRHMHPAVAHCAPRLQNMPRTSRVSAVVTTFTTPGCQFPPSVDGHWPVGAIIPSMMAEVLVIAKCIALNVSVVPQTGRFCTASAHAPSLSCIVNNG